MKINKAEILELVELLITTLEQAERAANFCRIYHIHKYQPTICDGYRLDALDIAKQKLKEWHAIADTEQEEVPSYRVKDSICVGPSGALASQERKKQ